MTRPNSLPGVVSTIPIPSADVPPPDGRPVVDVRIVVSHIGKHPIELFVHGSPRAFKGTANALARLVSTALQRGVPFDDVVAMLKGQADDGTYPWRPGGGRVVSLADGMAIALTEARDRLADEKDVPVELIFQEYWEKGKVQRSEKIAEELASALADHLACGHPHVETYDCDICDNAREVLEKYEARNDPPAFWKIP